MGNVDVAVHPGKKPSGLGNLRGRVVRYVPGFVVQCELIEGADSVEAQAAADAGSIQHKGAAYRRGDVVLCVNDSDPTPNSTQIAIFLADVNESHPAYPVLGHVDSSKQLDDIVANLPVPDEGTEILRQPINLTVGFN